MTDVAGPAHGLDENAIREGLDYLSSRDEDVASAVALIGHPAPRIRPAGFETLFNTIISQQISTEAAATIAGRVRALVPTLTAENLLAQSASNLRSAGMSGRKAEYALQLAQAIVDGRFCPDELPQLDDDQAIAAIVAMRGFGTWSAEIYLMFSLQRRDVFPADDLALQKALGGLKGLAAKPGATQSRDLVAHWAPWRSVGALFLWHYYRGAPT